ncbi:hypothetical protein [Streptomyces sp. enrichment culture]|uniref:hypothetical protein n=1 Tax=Streptomyces sp. enrichment culture TaxID=1795815 RepID=UPI003F558F4F
MATDADPGRGRVGIRSSCARHRVTAAAQCLCHERAMRWRIERTDARTWPDEQMKELFSEGFPEFITADRLVKEYMGRVGAWFADPNLTLVDENEVPVASGWGVPVRWDGRPETLPTGYTDALVRAVEGRERGVVADTLVICGAIVTPSLKGRGLAGEGPAPEGRGRRPGPGHRPGPADAEGAVPADADRDLHEVEPRGRNGSRPLDPDASASRRRDTVGRSRVTDHDRHRRRVGTLDRDGLPRVG